MLYITRCHWTMDTVLVKENAYKFCYHGLAMYAHTVERVSKLLKFFWEKGILSNSSILLYAIRVYILLIMKMRILILGRKKKDQMLLV